MGTYQIQSGLSLYASVFQTESVVNYYWTYVGLFCVSLICLRVWVRVEENKARQGVALALSTIEPRLGEEEDNKEDGVIRGLS